MIVLAWTMVGILSMLHRMHTAEGDILRLSECTACGYCLNGLAAEGICPECGVGYDQNSIVLYGRWRGSRVLLVLTCVAASILLLMGLLFVTGVRPLDARAARSVFLFVIVTVPGLLVLLKRVNSQRSDEIQLWLSETGCEQVDLDAGSIWYDLERRWRTAAMIFWVLYLIQQVPIVGHLMFLMVVSTVALERRPRTQQCVWALKWEDTVEMRLNRVAHGWHRLRFRKKNDILPLYWIDVIVRLTDAQAAELRRRITAWRPGLAVGY